jgi:hypothetical protein
MSESKKEIPDIPDVEVGVGVVRVTLHGDMTC